MARSGTSVTTGSGPAWEDMAGILPPLHRPEPSLAEKVVGESERLDRLVPVAQTGESCVAGRHDVPEADRMRTRHPHQQPCCRPVHRLEPDVLPAGAVDADHEVVAPDRLEHREPAE